MIDISSLVKENSQKNKKKQKNKPDKQGDSAQQPD